MLVFLFHGQGASSTTENSLLSSQTTTSGTVNPLDSLSSAEIAATAAQLARLPETVAIVNQADSDEAQLNMIAAGSAVLTKPQIVASNYYSNKDIKTYVVKNGDTLASVAKQFGLTSNTLLWSNNLTSMALTPGQKLQIPPVNGIVYTVKSGDTPSSLATKYDSNTALITAYNDAELKGLTPGEEIIIPGGQEPQTQTSYFSDNNSGFAWGVSAIYGENGYDFGECTWYVATRIPVPANWGNADTWAYYAARTPGWNVSPVPTVGSIAQRVYGYGHVAIVDAVNGNMVEITDMNGVAGWDRVGTAWQPISTYQNFISR